MSAALTLEQLGQIMPGAIAVIDEAIEAVKSATKRAEDAEARLAAHRDDLELVKVAKAAEFTDAEIRETVAEVVEAGFCPAELATKLATDLKSNPRTALATLRRVSQLSIPARTSGTGVRKNAYSFQREDVADPGDPNALSGEEIAAARRLHAEGA